MQFKNLRAPLCCAVLATVAPIATAASETWTGGSASSNNWSDVANWGGVTVNPTDILSFAGNTRLTPFNDLASATQINGITFNAGAGAFTLSGNAITLGDINSNEFAHIANVGSTLQTINLPLLGRGIEFDANSGPFNITAPITGAGTEGSVFLTGAGNLVNTISAPINNGPSSNLDVGMSAPLSSLWILSAVNTYAGNTEINGTLRADDGVGLPTNSHVNFIIGVLETGANFSRLFGTTQGVEIDNIFGVSAVGAHAVTVTLGAANSTLVWETNLFNPHDTIFLQDSNANQPLTIQHSFDLHGNTVDSSGTFTRNHIIRVNNSGSANAATVTGGIFDSVGGAIFIKDGPGWLIVNGSCSYSGPTVVTGGVLRANIPAAGHLTLNGILESGINLARTIGTANGQIQITAIAGFSAFGAPSSVTINAANSVLDVGSVNFAGISTLQTDLANQPLIFNNGLHYSSTVTSASIAVNNSLLSAPATITGSIILDNISAVFNKDGPGCLILAGPADSFFFTNINLGTLKLGAPDAVAIGSAVDVASGATFDLNGFTAQVVAINDNGIVTGTGTSNLNFVSSIDSTCAAQIIGNLSVAQAGSNILEFTATNSYAGVTTVAGGILRTNDGVGLPAASYLSISGGVFETGANLSRPLGNSQGNVELLSGVSGFSAFGPNSVTVTLGAALSVVTWGSGSFNPSTLVLQAASANQPLTLNNVLDIHGADRTITVNNSDQNSPAVLGAIVNTSVAAKLIKTGPGWLVLNSGGVNVNVQVSGGVLRADDGTTLISTDIISLQGGVLETGTNISRTLGTTSGRISVPSGNSGFSAFGANPVTVTLGTAGSTVAFGSATFSPAVLILQSQSANQPLTLNNSLNLSGATRTIAVQNSDPTAAATITGGISDSVGGAGLIKTGNGWLILASNSYFGQTTITQGVLRVATLPTGNLDLDGGILETPASIARSIGTGAGAIQFTGNAGFSAFGNAAVNITIGVANSVLNTGTVSFPGISTLQAATANQPLTFNNGIHYATPPLLNSVSLAVKNADPSASATITGPITFASATTVFHKTGPGWLTLSSTANSFDSVSIDGGVLRATLGVSLNTDAPINLAGGVFESPNSFTKTIGTAAGNIRLTGGDSGFSADLSVAVVTVTLNSAGAVLTWGSTINPSSLILQAVSARSKLALNNALNLNGATRTISVLNTNPNNFASISGNISDSTGGAGLTKSGPGRLILNGQVSYTGTTTVNAGTLVFNGSSNPLHAITGAGNIELAATRTLTADSISVNSLLLNANATVTLNDNGNSFCRVNTLTIAGPSTAPTATLDLKTAGLIIGYSTAPNGAALLTTTYQQVIAARGTHVSGVSDYSGNGITSSTASTNNHLALFDKFSIGVINNADLAAIGLNPAFTTFKGQTGVAVNSILARYTYSGDINLDGKINIDDYNYIDSGFGGLLSAFSGQIIGDFNNDALVNIDDYNIIDTGFGFQGAPLNDGDLSPLPGATFETTISPVPEPTTTMLLLPTATLLLLRRRNRPSPNSLNR